MPFFNDFGLFFCAPKSNAFVVIVSYPRYAKKIPPRNEIRLSMMLKCDILEKIKEATTIIGRSVIKGATAIFIPSFLLCFNVSVITSVSSGPGEIPAVKPKKAPMVKNVAEESVIIKTVLTVCRATIAETIIHQN